MKKKRERTKDVILKSNKRYTILDYIRIPLKACPIYTLIIGINRIISALIPSLIVFITANFIDTAISIFQGNVPFQKIGMPIFFYLLVIIFTNLNYTLIYGFINIRYDMAVFHNVRAALTEKRGKLEYKHMEDNETWNLISRTCDGENSLVGIAIGMNNLFDILELFLQFFSILAIITVQVWWASLVLIIVAIPLILIALKGGKNLYDSRKEVRKNIRIAEYFHDVLSKRDFIEERALFHYSDVINKKWMEHFEISRKKVLYTEVSNGLKIQTSSMLALFASFAIIGVLIIPAVQAKISIGIFIAIVNIVFNIAEMMSWRLSYVARVFAEKQEYLKDLTKFMALSEQEGALDEPEAVSNLSFEELSFVHVSFRYPRTKTYILKDFNLTLKKNRHYAFVGINGAGKTTITKLLTLMYQDYEGEILLNGKELRTYPLKDLKGLFSVVYQDFAKYQIQASDAVLLGNIMELNKKLAGQAYDIDRMHLILKEIDMEKVFEKLPNGLSTSLGKIKEDGVDLSGGEWQRLAVARTLYRSAHIRILDEPTAALDPIAESNIYKMFGRISKGKTTIFITHRLGAARLADQIIVIDDGKAAEIGSHEELIELNGIYAKMFESQKSWYTDKSGENEKGR